MRTAYNWYWNYNRSQYFLEIHPFTFRIYFKVWVYDECISPVSLQTCCTNPTMHQSISHNAPFAREMCKYVHISVTKWCIVSYLSKICAMGLLYRMYRLEYAETCSWFDSSSTTTDLYLPNTDIECIPQISAPSHSQLLASLPTTDTMPACYNSLANVPLTARKECDSREREGNQNLSQYTLVSPQ